MQQYQPKDVINCFFEIPIWKFNYKAICIVEYLCHTLENIRHFKSARETKCSIKHLQSSALSQNYNAAQFTHLISNFFRFFVNGFFRFFHLVGKRLRCFSHNWFGHVRKYFCENISCSQDVFYNVSRRMKGRLDKDTLKPYLQKTKKESCRCYIHFWMKDVHHDDYRTLKCEWNHPWAM